MNLDDNYLNGRDLQKYWSELESELDTLFQDLKDSVEDIEGDFQIEKVSELIEKARSLEDWAEYDDYKALKDIIDEVPLNETLISEDVWVDYCREYVYDTGMIETNSNLDHYFNFEKFAEDMQSDFSQLEINGNTYYYRC